MTSFRLVGAGVAVFCALSGARPESARAGCDSTWRNVTKLRYSAKHRFFALERSTYDDAAERFSDAKWSYRDAAFNKLAKPPVPLAKAEARPLKKRRLCAVKAVRAKKGWRVLWYERGLRQHLLVEQGRELPEPGGVAEDAPVSSTCGVSTFTSTCYAAPDDKLVVVLRPQPTSDCNCTWFEDVLLVAPKTLDYLRYNIRGLRALKRRRVKEAVKLLRKSVELKPNYTRAVYNLACALARAGRPFSEGQPLLRRVLASPEGKDYRRTMARDRDLKPWRAEPGFRKLK
jgi:hypothetical protein